MQSNIDECLFIDKVINIMANLNMINKYIGMFHNFTTWEWLFHNSL